MVFRWFFVGFRWFFCGAWWFFCSVLGGFLCLFVFSWF